MGNDNDKDQTVAKDIETVVSVKKRQQREDSLRINNWQANINEISKRNEETEKRERKSFYKVAGIIALLIIAIIFLLYFFS